MIPPMMVPQFREVFAAFGADLPSFTQFFVHHSYALWLLPLLVLAAWFYWPKPARRALVACSIGVVSLLVIVPALTVAMYLPIFMLAPVS